VKVEGECWARDLREDERVSGEEDPKESRRNSE